MSAFQSMPPITTLRLADPVDDHDSWPTLEDHCARLDSTEAAILRMRKDRHLAAARKLVGSGELRDGEGPWYARDRDTYSFLFKFDRRGECVLTREARQ